MGSVLQEISSRRVILLLVLPIHAICMTPIKLAKTLGFYVRKSRVSGFRALQFDFITSLNYYFYLTRFYSLKKYGVHGFSPYLGLGKANMSRSFHYSKLGLHLFSTFGVHFILACSILFISAQFLWLNFVTLDKVCLGLLLLTISPAHYTQTFKWQNYNFPGWIFFSIFLIYLSNDDLPYALFIAGLIPIFSFTAGIFAVACALYMSIVHLSMFPLWNACIILSVLILKTRPILFSKNGKLELKSLLSALGFLSLNKKKYRRDKSKGAMHILFFYLFLHLICIGTYAYTYNVVPDILIFSAGLFLFNHHFRFADLQSLVISWTCCSIFVFMTHEGLMTYIVLWISLLTFPRIIGFHNYKDCWTIVPDVEVCDTNEVLKRLNTFFYRIPKTSRILFALPSPGGSYSSLFNGLRAQIQSAHFIAVQNDIHLIPDELALNLLNDREAPEMWAENLSDCKIQIKKWSVDYIITNRLSLRAALEYNNFQTVSTMNWEVHQHVTSRYKKNFNSKSWFLISANPVN